ncbi:hypothetical protein EmuJ_000273700 [Echinococcus multilocularis]|uniref:Uncharacterized protein n=1 Tax=Echinococcus multilocularis TaxID=6211 RepID=A0A068XT58_ECHMU|nr:hypothetical protein EmuJ_000273700 [Echinococcus multilocularis]
MRTRGRRLGKCPEALAKEAEEEDCQIDCPADPGLLGTSTAELPMKDTLVAQEKRSLALGADAKPQEDAELLDPMAAGSPVLPEAGPVKPLALVSEDAQGLVDLADELLFSPL